MMHIVSPLQIILPQILKKLIEKIMMQKIREPNLNPNEVRVFNLIKNYYLFFIQNFRIINLL